MKRASATLLLALGAAGCFDFSALPDLSGAPDAAGVPGPSNDLASPGDHDGAARADLAFPATADLTVVAQPADFAMAHPAGDLATEPPDLSVAPGPDLLAADLASAPDLADPYAWVSIPTNTNESLSSVYATSPTDVWMVGFLGSLLHYDGLAVSRVAYPQPAVQSPIPRRVIATSATSIYFVTNNGAVLHTSDAGMTWVERDLPTQDMVSIFATPSAVWAAGVGLVEVDDGGDNWGVSLDGATIGPGYGLTDIWGASAMELWTTGGPTLWHTTDGGNTWHSVMYPVPNGGGWGHAMWGSAWNNVYMVGDYGYIWQQQGGGWTAAVQPVPLTSNMGFLYSLRAVWGTSNGATVYAVGDLGTVIYNAGAGWKSDPTPFGTGVKAPSIQGVSGASNMVFVVGNDGIFLRQRVH